MATLYVPFLNPIFKTQPLSLFELTICLATSAVVWVVVEIEKGWRRARGGSATEVDVDRDA
jgi:Ca2+-transporting ATPase